MSFLFIHTHLRKRNPLRILETLRSVENDTLYMFIALQFESDYVLNEIDSVGVRSTVHFMTMKCIKTQFFHPKKAK